MNLNTIGYCTAALLGIFPRHSSNQLMPTNIKRLPFPAWGFLFEAYQPDSLRLYNLGIHDIHQQLDCSMIPSDSPLTPLKNAILSPPCLHYGSGHLGRPRHLHASTQRPNRKTGHQGMLILLSCSSQMLLLKSLLQNIIRPDDVVERVALPQARHGVVERIPVPTGV